VQEEGYKKPNHSDQEHDHPYTEQIHDDAEKNQEGDDDDDEHVQYTNFFGAS
jgi:hypothetical protein